MVMMVKVTAFIDSIFGKLQGKLELTVLYPERNEKSRVLIINVRRLIREPSEKER